MRSRVLQCTKRAIKQRERSRHRAKGQATRRTRLGREHIIVVKEVLHPSHYVVNVGGCGELDTLAVLIDPGVVQPVK